MNFKLRHDPSISSRWKTFGQRAGIASPLSMTAVCFGLLLLLPLPSSLAAQDWFKTGTGLGVSKPKVAVADFAPRTPTSPTFATLFGDVLRNDLDYSGVVDIASKSFYPTQV